jgi:hypothetical protein
MSKVRWKAPLCESVVGYQWPGGKGVTRGASEVWLKRIAVPPSADSKRLGDRGYWSRRAVAAVRGVV